MVDTNTDHDNTMSITKLYDLTDHTEQIWCCKFNPTGNLLITTGTDKTIHIYKYIPHVNKYVHCSELTQTHTRTIRTVAFHPNSKLLASGSFDSQINIYQLNDNADDSDTMYELYTTLEGHENEIKCVAYNTTGELLASCSRDKSIWIWHATTDTIDIDYECLSVLNGHTADIKYIVWLNENTLLSASYDNTIRVWQDDADSDDFDCIQVLGTTESHTDNTNNDTHMERIGHNSTVWCLAVNPNNSNQFVSCSDDCSIILWTRTNSTSKFEQTLKLSHVHKRTIFSIDWNSANYIVTAGADNQIVLYQYSEIDNKPSITIQCRLKNAHKNDINCIAFKPNSQQFCTVSDDITVSMWQYSKT